MLRFIRGLGQWVVLIGAVMSTVYAVEPDVRRWVETELVARDAHYYVGAFTLAPGLQRPKFLQFYSNRWEMDDLIFDRRIMKANEDAFDVFRALDNETLIAYPDTEYGPMPGRDVVHPTAPIRTLALANDCYLVRDIACRMTLPDGDSYSVQTDPGCKMSEAYTDARPSETHTVYLWVRAVRYTCH